MKELPWRSAALVTLGALLGRVLGVGREAVFAHYFGASFQTDAYLVAVLLPTLVQNVVAGGTIQAAFIPVIAEESVRNGRAAACQLVANLTVLTLAALACVALGIALFAEPIVRLTASGFSAEAAALGADLLRWCTLLIVLNGFLAVALGALNTFGEFRTTAALSPVLNTVQIAVMIMLAPWIGIGAAVAGLLIGTAVQCVLQLAPLHRAGVHLGKARWSVGIWRRIGPVFVPAALAALAAQGNPLADKVIGSFLVAGSITHLNYADLFAGSVAIVTTSVALVTFPTMTTALAEGDPERALRVLRQAVHVNLLTAVPVSCLLGAFAPDVVRLVYGWGRLGPSDLAQVARCLLAYSVGIPFTGLFYVLLRACYAVRRPIYAFALSVVYFVIHVVVAVALAPRLGPAGLALGTSAGAIATGLGGWFLLRSELLRRAGATAAGTSFRLGLVAAASTALPLLSLRPWTSENVSAAAALWRLPLAVVLGAAVLLPLVNKVDPESSQVLARAWARAVGRVRGR